MVSIVIITYRKYARISAHNLEKARVRWYNKKYIVIILNPPLQKAKTGGKYESLL